MKKLLLLAVLSLAAASQVQAEPGTAGTCGYKEIRCATPPTQHTYTCPGCAACVCPEPARVVCEAKAVPMSRLVCPQEKTCGHKVRVSGCEGCNRRFGTETKAEHKRHMRTPRRVDRNEAAAAA